MNWQEVCEHPNLKNLPFKIELNEQGQILMSPAKVYHSILQGEIAGLLKQYTTQGKVLTKCAIYTSKGTKVADVAWASQTVLQQIKHEIECSIAPEICIEILSSSNTIEEMAEKRTLYFAQGAQEVWICDADGKLSFYQKMGILEASGLLPDFPVIIE